MIAIDFVCPWPGCKYFYRGLSGTAELREKGLRQHIKRVHEKLWKAR